MTTSYLTLITYLISAVLGGTLALIGVFLTNRSNAERLKSQQKFETQKHKRDMIWERGEELYELFDRWMRSFSIYYLNTTFVMQGKLTKNEFYELINKSGKEYPVNPGRIKVLIEIYFPAILPAYDLVEKRKSELIAIDTEHSHAYDAGDIDGRRFIAPFINCQKNFEKAGEEFLSKLIVQIRDI